MELTITIPAGLELNCINGVSIACKRPEAVTNGSGESIPNPVSKEEFLCNIVRSFLTEHCIENMIETPKTAFETAIAEAKVEADGKISVSIKE